MSNPIWIPAILMFLAAVLGTLSLALVSEALRDWWRRRQVAKRMRPVLTGQSTRSKAVEDLVRGGQDDKGLFGMLKNLVPGLRSIETLLEQSRVEWSPMTFLILTVGLAAGVGGFAFLFTGSVLWFFFLSMVAAFCPYFFLAQRRAWRFKRFEEEFPEGIDLLTRAIRAGHPLTSGVGMVADEGPPNVAMEFRQVFEEQRFGLPFEEALLGFVDRVGLMDVRIFAIAVLIQREVGGNLAETLENLAHTIRRRFYLRRQLRVYTAQGRMTGYALAALPVFVGVAIFFITPEYVSLLVTHPFGKLMLGSALVLQGIGVLWIRKIINIDI